MVSVGDTVPEFTAPLANGEVAAFDVSDALADAPLVFAFFPGAFTSVCSSEMATFQERLGEFESAGASVYGISVDTPFAQNEFREQLNLSFGLLSDSNRELVDAFDVSMDFASLGVDEVAKRAVFVVDGDGTVTYAWVSDDPGVEPDYDEVVEAVESTA
jgi:peroxiredoxin